MQMTNLWDIPSNSSYDLAVVGAGAAGLMAAAAACLAMPEISVLLIEKEASPGRKLSATGNGRGNITHTRILSGDLRADDYHSESGFRALDYALEKGMAECLALFRAQGVYFHQRDEFVYPAAERAEALTQALLRMLSDRVRIAAGTKLVKVTPPSEEGGGFELDVTSWSRERAPGKEAKRKDVSGVLTLRARRVILAMGSPAAPQISGTEDVLSPLASLVLTTVPLLPALVPLLSEDPALKPAKGLRFRARVGLEADGERVRVEEGEVQVGDGQLSGLPILQLSGEAVRRIAAGETVQLILDLLPAPPYSEMLRELPLESDRAAALHHILVEDPRELRIDEALSGLIPRGVAAMLTSRLAMDPEKKLRKLSPKEREALFHLLRDFRLTVQGPAGADKAQVYQGGLSMADLSPDGEVLPGLYAAGEMLDVDGRCGGFNLSFAMTGGYRAGISAARSLRDARSAAKADASHGEASC